MRKLTFEGFLKQYVTELSGVQTASIHKLANCLHENPRLKEPLYLYALVFDKVNLLLRYAKDPVCLAEYERLSNESPLNADEKQKMAASAKTLKKVLNDGLANLEK